MDKRLALIGFGEAGSTFAKAAGWGANVAVWDVLPVRRQAAAAMGLAAASCAQEAMAGAPLVLSLVTADQALPAARDYARHLSPGALWCDGNSVAPGTKRAAAAAAEAAGAGYVDTAILAPVNPPQLAVPILLAGPHADRAEVALRALGFRTLRSVGPEIGRACAIKMIRSVMIKGIEALTAEMMLAADTAGVTDEVLASLDASEKAQTWSHRVAYNLERMVTHGARRAAEMAEAASALQELGIEPVMTAAIVRRQADMAGRDDVLKIVEGDRA